MIEICIRFPDTPNTLLKYILDGNASDRWNMSWTSFYKVYNNIIIIMTRNVFEKFNFNYSEADLKDVLCDVFFSLHQIFIQKKYIFENHCFRGLLKKVVTCRTIDYIRKKYPKHVVEMEYLDFTDALLASNGSEFFKSNSFEKFEENEERAYKQIKIYRIWDKIKNSYDENNAIIFEMVYLKNRTIRDVCKEFGLSRTAVDNALHRIMKRIKKEYAKIDKEQEGLNE